MARLVTRAQLRVLGIHEKGTFHWPRGTLSRVCGFAPTSLDVRQGLLLLLHRLQGLLQIRFAIASARPPGSIAGACALAGNGEGIVA